MIFVRNEILGSRVLRPDVAGRARDTMIRQTVASVVLRSLTVADEQMGEI